MTKDVKIVQHIVDSIKQQMLVCVEDFAGMQKELSEVDIIKDQVAALLTHAGLKVEFCAAAFQGKLRMDSRPRPQLILPLLFLELT